MRKFSVRFNGKLYFLYGGPFSLKPDGFFSVNLTQDLSINCNLNIPICDFNTPSNVDSFLVSLWVIINHVLRYQGVYIGCYSGLGRTGMVLAILLRIFNEAEGHYSDSVSNIRAYYHINAIETENQEYFVRTVNIQYLVDYLRTMPLCN
jgi:protein-tyrosine phosphatase